MIGENHYLSYDTNTFRRIKYFRDHVADAYSQINFEKAREDEVDYTSTKEYKEYNKQYQIFYYFNELFGQKIIDEDGEPLEGKKKCFEFFLGRYAGKDSASALKMSISLVLLVLLL